MKIGLSLLGLIFCSAIFGQVGIKKSCIDSGGASSQAGTLKMVYTIGEVAIAEKTSGIVTISEGFINRKTLINTGIVDYSLLSGVDISPNPSTEKLYVKFSNASKFTISLYDLNGKLIYNLTTQDIQAEIEVGQFIAGVYSLIIVDEVNKKYKGFKIIKQ